jgi:hypothetical protein
MKTYKEFKKNLTEADEVDALPAPESKPERSTEKILSYKYDLEKKMIASFGIFTRVFVDWIQHAYESEEIDANDREYAEYKLHDLFNVMLGSAINKAENLRNIVAIHGLEDVKHWDSKKEISKTFKRLEKPLTDFVLTYMNKVEEMKKTEEKNKKKAEKTNESKKTKKSKKSKK